MAGSVKKQMKPVGLQGSDFVRRIITAGAFWAIAKALDTPQVARVTRKFDRKLSRSSHTAAKSFRRAGSNARRHKGLLIAGVSALAVAAGLLGRATTR